MSDKPSMLGGLDKYYKDWEKRAGSMNTTAQPANIDWSKLDVSKLMTDGMGVRIGAPLTEEQFKEYQAQKTQKKFSPGP